jgi:hypothetical protein
MQAVGCWLGRATFSCAVRKPDVGLTAQSIGFIWFVVRFFVVIVRYCFVSALSLPGPLARSCMSVDVRAANAPA